MTMEHHQPHLDTHRERVRLVGLAALMLAAGLGLAASGGPPRLPSGVPRPGDVLAMLGGSTLPLEAVALVLVDVAWLLWVWIVGSLVLELLLVLAEAVAHGAAWVRSLRAIASRLSVPLVRRAVAAAFAVQVVSRGVSVASAEPIRPAQTTLLDTHHAAQTGSNSDAATGPTYLVRAGDTLWSIAEQAYGSGAEYRRILEANLGRRMPDGQVFSARGVIRPGWELVVPDAGSDLEEADGQRWYTVKPGDTLSAVAGRLTSDESRWAELFELNRGTITADGRHVLADANVIWPGLRLRVPPDADPPEVDPSHTTLPPASDDAEPPTGPHTDGPAPDLVAARAPVETEMPRVPLDNDGPLVAPEAEDAPPLLRTPHRVDPVVLEPADAAAGGEADSTTGASGDTSPPAGATRGDMPVAPLALGALALAGLGGLAFGARRVRRLRPLPQQPESEVVVEGGFAEAQLAQDFTRGLHGVGFDPLAGLVGQLEAFLREHNLTNAGVVSVRHGRSATTITITAGLAEQARLVDLAPLFAARLNADAEARVSADQDVVVRLVRSRRTRLLPTAEALRESPRLVPLGVLYDRQVYSAAWASLGHVLVASLPGHGADTILTSLVATLTARRSPEHLRVWVIGSSRALPAPVFDLPHLDRVVDPADELGLMRAADDLRAELDRRATQRPEADLVVVVPELMSLGDQAARFELLVARAADLGVRVVAATTCPDQVPDSPLLSQLTTRMVLRMHEEEASVALLGVADAAFLGGGGRLLLRLDGREPVELYGYQVAMEHLERLVRVMRSAYPAGGPPAPPRSTSDLGANDAVPPEQRDAPEATAAMQQPAGVVDATHAAGEAPPAPAQSVQGAPTPAPAARRPPIEVICFGGPRVLCAGQQIWPRLPGGEVKPWELLLYLAAQPAEGVSTRDAVEALWSDDDSAEDAPHRFRQLRYRLRRMLAEVEGAPETDGICLERGVLRLDPDVVHSDAQEFLSLVRRARIMPGPEAIEPLERARSLYEGDLLAGPEARRYAWVDERDPSGVTLREHFRRLYQQASVKLAELYAAGEAVQAALDLYRELTEIDPGDERLWRALFRLHAERGDRVALVREERRMRAALRELAADVDDQPTSHAEDVSRETVQEYQRLLASLSERDREPATA
jgi:nucleoid-associated protein YgaU/two-component SAPR family response regulator